MKYKSVAIFLILFGVQSCGSGSGGESNPIGLFTEPPTEASVSLPSDGSVQNAMGLFNSQIGQFGVSTTFSSVSKSISMGADPGCEQIDSHHVTCNSGLPGPAGGGVNYQLSFNCEDTSNGGTCDVPMVLQFGNYAYSNDCQKTLEVSGVFRCQLTHVLEAESGEQVSGRFSGQCNTQDPSNKENQIILNVDGKQIKVGFDLGVQFEEKIALHSKQSLALKEMNLKGVISVNGVSYPFETLNNMGPSQCP